MTTSFDNALHGDKSAIEKLKLSLEEEAKDTKSKKITDFAEAYPVIEQHLNAGVSKKVVLEKFNAAFGQKIYGPQFRKMLESERERRNENGEVIVCLVCGSPLALTAEHSSSAESDTANSP